MALRVLLLFLVGLLVCSAADDKGGDDSDTPSASCSSSAGDSIRLTAPKMNLTCGSVEGRVEVCEDILGDGEEQWRKLCDDNWTVEDAQVVCRSLNYSGNG